MIINSVLFELMEVLKGEVDKLEASIVKETRFQWIIIRAGQRCVLQI